MRTVLWTAFGIFVSFVAFLLVGAAAPDGTVAHSGAVAIDYCFEAAIFWRDKSKMTLSSQCHESLLLNRKDFFYYVGSCLNYLNPGHTYQAVVADLQRANATIAELTPFNKPL